MATEDHPWAVAISFLLGWTYFLLWSASFYPQPIYNYLRRSTSGLAIDFPFCNVIGMTCYTLSNGLLLFNPIVRAQYAELNPDAPIPTVAVNDFVYALHGAICVTITLSQFIPGLWPFERLKPAQRPSITMLIICGTNVLIILLACYSVGAALPVMGTPPPDQIPHWNWANVTSVLASTKVFLTVIKYTPQVMLNWRSRSTAGFNIHAVIMDAVGSVLSLAQLFIDAAIIQGGDWSDVTRNPGKFGLGNVSLAFNIIFLLQHYVFYRAQPTGVALDDDSEAPAQGDEVPVGNEQSPLLARRREPTQDTAVS